MALKYISSRRFPNVTEGCELQIFIVAFNQVLLPPPLSSLYNHFKITTSIYAPFAPHRSFITNTLQGTPKPYLSYATNSFKSTGATPFSSSPPPLQPTTSASSERFALTSSLDTFPTSTTCLWTRTRGSLPGVRFLACRISTGSAC